MPNKADKFDLRLRIIKSVQAIGVKPTAELFDTTAKTVRKWLSRYREERLTGLNELPRTPHHCPHKTSPSIEVNIVALRKRFPFKGSKRLKREHDLTCSHEAIRRILNEHGLNRKRIKKHKRKKCLSEIKKQWMLFGQLSIDTKDFKDIPHYCPKMKMLKLTKYQFTAREVRSGLMFLGFANEKSASNACLFAQILCQHLHKCGVDMNNLKIQTDNGMEFIGCFRQDKTRDGFEKVVEGFGSTHKRIPVKAWSYNCDVETVHSTIENEFYDMENFESIKDFHRRSDSYQTWYNIVRENSNKDYKTPLQIIREVGPNIDPSVAKLPPFMLDWLGPDYITKDELLQRGYDVPCYP
ncbi:MAG: helix-turn-helix domain-containing protein [Sedimentisphaerales bacterium]